MAQPHAPTADDHPDHDSGARFRSPPGRCLTRPQPGGPSLVALLATATLAAAARAESPPTPCQFRAEFRPNVLSTPDAVPANAPAVVFHPGRGWVSPLVADWQIELREQDQTVIPVTFQAEGDSYLIRPSHPPRGNVVTIRYRDLCSSFPTTAEVTLGLGPASPLPTTVGTARLRNGAASHQSDPPACLPAPVNMILDVTMSPELLAYRNVTRWDITYKGTLRRVGYGDLPGSGGLGHVLLDDVCTPTTERVGGPVTIAAHVAGAASDPAPLQLTVDGACPYFRSNKAPPPCPIEDAGGPPEPPGPFDARPVDVTPAPVDANQDAAAGARADMASADAGAPPADAAGTRARSGGGCALGSDGTGPWPTGATGWAMLAAALATLMGRRRRPR